MEDWPTNATPFCLLLGVPPLIYVVARGAIGTNQEGLSLRFWGIVFIWLGYHFSPWLYWLDPEGWTIFLLVARYIDECLVFSALSMYAYLVGYEWANRRRGLDTPGNMTQLVLPTVPPSLLIGLSALAVLLFLVEVGGPTEVLVSTQNRGDKDWEIRDFQGKIVQMLTILGRLVALALACVASIFVVDNKNAWWQRIIVGASCLVLASLSQWHFFSRGSGFAFAILGVILAYQKGIRALPVVVLAFLLAGFLGSVGMNRRNDFNPGLANYCEALAESMDGSGRSSDVLTCTPDNFPLNAVDPWTRMAQLRDEAAPDPIELVLPYLWNLNPLPSEIFGLATVSPDLTDVMGTRDVTNLTTPAAGELYYAFGFWSFVVWIPLGMVYGYFDSYHQRNCGVVSSLCFLLCLISFPIGGHSPMRTMTRPLVYAAALLLFSHYFQRYHRHLTQARPLGDS